MGSPAIKNIGSSNRSRGSELTEAIRVAGARGSVGVRVEAGGTWGVWTDGYPDATLHAVLAGEVWLNLPNQPSELMRAGDVVWLPADLGHGLSAQPGLNLGPCNHASAAHSLRSGASMRLGHTPAQTRLMTLHYTHDPEVSSPTVLALSAPMHLSAREYPMLTAVNQLLDHELARQQPGTTAAVNSLIDLLLVHFVRALLGARTDDTALTSFGNRVDPFVRDAINLIHRDPRRAWTTDSLAAAIGVSRASLTRHFAASLGQAPGVYLTGWRMDLAALRLRDTDEPIQAIARSVGYVSPNAFSRAFRRIRGRAPSEYRTHSRDEATRCAVSGNGGIERQTSFSEQPSAALNAM